MNRPAKRPTVSRREELEQALARTGSVAATMRVTGATYEEVQYARAGILAADEAEQPTGRPSKCGTLRRYREHLRSGQAPDRDCLRAWVRSTSKVLHGTAILLGSGR
jgi:hypothetical protein